MATAPAGLAGLPSKGRITVGADADFCVFAPEETWLIEPATLHHRHPLTPYTGRLVTGRVRATWLRGERINDSRPTGRLLSGTSDE
jgi:allantoinase